MLWVEGCYIPRLWLEYTVRVSAVIFLRALAGDEMRDRMHHDEYNSQHLQSMSQTSEDTKTDHSISWT